MSYDMIALTASCVSILVYYLYLVRRTRRAPESSVHTLNARVREQWVDMIMSKDHMEILAVQTLRNSVMASNFMASTAVLLIIGTLNLSEKIGQWSLNWYPFAMSQSEFSNLWQIKLAFLLLDFSIAFYCFSMAIRFFNHVGYMINLPGDASTKLIHQKKTCIYLNKAGSYYTFGNRAFFFSLPIVMWFLGPCFLLLATLALTGGLVMLDKAPD
jgi:uncharacterized membrane protein